MVICLCHERLNKEGSNIDEIVSFGSCCQCSIYLHTFLMEAATVFMDVAHVAHVHDMTAHIHAIHCSQY